MANGKHRVVVVGGSFGGVNAAYQLRRKLGDRVEVTLISADADFLFIPSLPWVMMGWRKPDAIKVPLAGPLRRKGVSFIHDRATAIDPQAQTVTTAGGKVFPYDHVVLATGSDLDWSNVPGSDPAEGTVHTCFTVKQAVAARDAIARFLASDGGRAIIGANPGASCTGPAYEIIMMLETALRRQKRRHLFDLHLVTPEPFLGHFGVNGIGNMSRMMEDEFHSRHLKWTTSAALTAVEPGKATLADGTELPFDLAVLIPAFYGAQVARDVEGLGNPRGFIPTDKHLRSTKYSNIYAVGVSVAIAPPVPTPVPVGVPKTGHMCEEMATRAAANIAVEVTGSGELVDGLTLPATCVADAGDVGFYIKADPFLPPRNVAVLRRGVRYHYVKLAFERFYLEKVKRDLPAMHFGW
ncbi:MAG: FAD-dependent oxidoreductase [Actinobacteria bacterium]|nr:FAD-dependent oxidoreductase [Actinomycetota bacterium]